MKKEWGMEILIDCAECDPESIRRIEHIEAFITELCEKTEMKKWGKIHALCLEDDEYNREHDIVGYSVCQFIQTSSIVGHFCETTNTMYLDFFSCKHFKEDDVIQLVIKYFRPMKVKHQTVMRDAIHN
jgi:S-adenosylmethionine/arginine decarboxylase-like enzyme